MGTNPLIDVDRLTNIKLVVYAVTVIRNEVEITALATRLI